MGTSFLATDNAGVYSFEDAVDSKIKGEPRGFGECTGTDGIQ
jgi:hypothetical protein